MSKVTDPKELITCNWINIADNNLHVVNHTTKDLQVCTAFDLSTIGISTITYTTTSFTHQQSPTKNHPPIDQKITNKEKTTNDLWPGPLFTKASATMQLSSLCLTTIVKLVTE